MINSLLRTDYYKCCHMLQYDKKISHLTSYLVPRQSRLVDINKMVFFGLSNFINHYLIEDFNENFFYKPFDEIKEEFVDYLCGGLGYKDEQIKQTLNEVLKLYNLGYLPIEINALPEGTICPMQVPAIEIRTTHPSFPWVGQVIESILSSSIWHPCISATISHQYAKIAKAAYERTVDDKVDYRTAMADFSMRGQESYESAVASSAAFLTSFFSSSTVEAADYINRNYGGEAVEINGLVSTEHSVMCSDFAINDGDERVILKRLLTEIYPDVSFSAVLDSKDFWNVVTQILPTLKTEIKNHEGFFGIRHDSAADPALALCGIPEIHISAEKNGLWEDFIGCNNEESFIHLFQYWLREAEPFGDEVYFKKAYITFENKELNFSLKGVFEINSNVESERGGLTSNKYYFTDGFTAKKIREEKTPEEKGMVEVLYEIFGGELNSKGYKVVNPKVKAIYGDGITISRADDIYRRLEAKGFAANNVSLGVGSFSMQCIENGVRLNPFTRDTFSIAIKATYGEIMDSQGKVTSFNIFKAPKGNREKKSLTGLCKVIKRQEDGELVVLENLTKKQYEAKEGEFIPYFKNSKSFTQDFEDIRQRLV